MNQLSPDQFISKLYRGTTQVSLTDFPEWALEQLRSVIEFDGAIWATGHVSEKVFQTQNSLDIDLSFFDHLQKYRDINPMYQALLATKGQAIDMADIVDDEQFYRSEVYQKCFAPHGIERILSSIHLDERSGIFTLLTLYRFDRERRFSPEDKDTQQKLLFHLLSAASHRQFLTLKGYDLDNHGKALYALVDDKGIYHAVEPQFLDAMIQFFPNADSQRLPVKLDDGKLDEQDSPLYFEAMNVGDLYRISVRAKQELDKLTAREKEVVSGICAGSTFKQVARDLNLSPSTVSNHLYRIYTKLGVNTRSELIKLVNEQN